MSNRASEHLAKIPVITLGILIINCSVHAIIFLFSLQINNFAINPSQVLRGEWYRIITSAFVHGGIIHIFMNMTSLLQLGGSLEKQFGSMQFLFLTVWSILLTGWLYVLLSWGLSRVFHDPYQMHSSSVGYSGVLFTYAVIEANHTVELTRSLFGMFNVPSRLLPFVLLVLLQVLVPGISFVGHVSGIIVGLLFIGGLMKWIVPNEASLSYLELQVFPFSSLSRLSSYVRCTDKDMTIPTLRGGYCFPAIWDVLKSIGKIISNIFGVIFHIIGVDSCCMSIQQRFTSGYTSTATSDTPTQAQTQGQTQAQTQTQRMSVTPPPFSSQHHSEHQYHCQDDLQNQDSRSQDSRNQGLGSEESRYQLPGSEEAAPVYYNRNSYQSLPRPAHRPPPPSYSSSSGSTLLPSSTTSSSTSPSTSSASSSSSTSSSSYHLPPSSSSDSYPISVRVSTNDKDVRYYPVTHEI